MSASIPAVDLPGTGITTSVLGYGCSRLLGPHTEAEALHLLGVAHDAGIRHLDVARSYGSGDVEALVGRFLRGRRDEFTVTSKFGIQPLPALARRRGMLRVARRAMRLSPRVRRVLGRQGARLVRTSAFSVPEARASVEASLRALGTDHLDILLLHDCALADCQSVELQAFLDGEVVAGRIGAYGVGTDVAGVLAVLDSAPAFAGVVQCEDSVVRPSRGRVEAATRGAVVTHGALAGLGPLKRHLAGDPADLDRWRQELDLDCGDPSVLAGLALSAATAAARRGPVLFSSVRAANVVVNADVVSRRPYTDEQVRTFTTLVAGVPGLGA